MHTGKAIALDPFEMENPNAIIVGSPGGGKSFWMKDAIEQYVLDGARVFVLDIEDEYRLLCDDLGGAYLDMGSDSEHKINVLDVDPDDPEGLTGAFESFAGWIVSVLRRELSAEEEQMLDKAYRNAFAAKGFDRAQRHTLANEAPLLSDLYDALMSLRGSEINAEHAIRLASAIDPMAHGLEAEAFNCRTNIDVRSNPFVVFGLSSVKEQMMPRRIRQIQQFTWNQMTRSNRTIEIVDEAWWLLHNPATAADLAARVRRFRKKNSAIFIATQHVKDFASNEHAHAVLGLVGTQMLFQQNAISLKDVTKTFELNEAEAGCVADLRQGHYLLKTNRLSMVMHNPCRLRAMPSTPPSPPSGCGAGSPQGSSHA
ncbi:MAG: hypothetical protein HC853_08620, partial [Anaerolineae bacterium]|nr:hypothetical protein [Anaerolineae bacterium]